MWASCSTKRRVDAQTTPDIRLAIEAHRPEVEAEYRRIVERAERSNPPEVQAIIDSRRPFVQAKMAEILQKARERRVGEHRNESSKIGCGRNQNILQFAPESTCHAANPTVNSQSDVWAG